METNKVLYNAYKDAGVKSFFCKKENFWTFDACIIQIIKKMKGRKIWSGKY